MNLLGGLKATPDGHLIELVRISRKFIGLAKSKNLCLSKDVFNTILPHIIASGWCSEKLQLM